MEMERLIGIQRTRHDFILSDNRNCFNPRWRSCRRRMVCLCVQCAVVAEKWCKRRRTSLEMGCQSNDCVFWIDLKPKNGKHTHTIDTVATAATRNGSMFIDGWNVPKPMLTLLVSTPSKRTKNRRIKTETYYKRRHNRHIHTILQWLVEPNGKLTQNNEI